jgi:Formyl transferase
MPPEVVLLTPLRGEALDAVSAAFRAPVTVVRTLDDLRGAVFSPATTLIAYGSGVIVPADVLGRVMRSAFNFHAASPDYPGRDPHHFAIYDGARHYGATAHVMTDRVDTGPIIECEWFDVPPGTDAARLLDLANAAMLRLARRIGPLLLTDPPPPPNPILSWGARRTTRRNFLDMCRVSPTIGSGEFERRFRAFDGGTRDNLVTDLHGWSFRIDKSVPRRTVDRRWEDFTEESYRELLRLAAEKGYSFADYTQRPEGRHVLWRHDVDLSLHRAAKLAAIEREEGARSTYFLNPHAAFYNLLEPACLDLVARVIELGHAIGLHFDAAAYPGMQWSRQTLAEMLARERALLETFLGAKITAFSYHNPEADGLIDIDDDEVAGLVNCYGRTLRTEYGYVSDSNGYWRFHPIAEVLATVEHRRLQVLTHPGWWTPEPLPPRKRVLRCVHGRAEAVMARYDEFLREQSRKNISC